MAGFHKEKVNIEMCLDIRVVLRMNEWVLARYCTEDLAHKGKAMTWEISKFTKHILNKHIDAELSRPWFPNDTMF